VLSAPKRFDLDLQDYKAAIHNAEDVDFTRRTKLYDLYADTLLDTHLLNYDMADIFESMGIHTQGGEFTVAKPKDATETANRAAILEKARTVFQLPMDDDYLYEQLSIDKPDDYDRLKKELLEQAEKNRMLSPFGMNPQNRAQSFFAVAPQQENGALDW
jgi:hypothetical protein